MLHLYAIPLSLKVLRANQNNNDMEVACLGKMETLLENCFPKKTSELAINEDQNPLFDALRCENDGSPHHNQRICSLTRKKIRRKR